MIIKFVLFIDYHIDVIIITLNKDLFYNFYVIRHLQIILTVFSQYIYVRF